MVTQISRQRVRQAALVGLAGWFCASEPEAVLLSQLADTLNQLLGFR